ncbi:hypothetical protein GCM10009727_53430 [Actinomadura napierensis]|uniref:WXG100 family type VII secretion target n=1 Tax=Actinomadura napierensis TaxID=267854 RepID=A0ABP5LLN5_9ACTN
MTLHPYEPGIRPGSLGHGDPAQYDYLTIKSFFANAKPADLEGLQQAYISLQSALQDLEQRLGQHTKRLNQIWDGDAQQAGTSEVKQLTENAATLAKASGQFGTAMSSGAAALRNPPRIPPPTGPAASVPGLLGEAAATPADNKAAQEALAKTNASLASAFDQIPSALALSQDLDLGDTPYLSGGSGTGAPGMTSAAGGGNARAGVPAGGTSTSSNGGSASASPSMSSPERLTDPRPIRLLPGDGPRTPVPTPSHGSPTNLAGSMPGVGQNPGVAPGAPATTPPVGDGGAAPGLGQVPPAGGGQAGPLPSKGAQPRPTSEAQTGVGRPRLSTPTDSPESQIGRPVLGGASRLSPGGVIGGKGFNGMGGIGQESLEPYGAAGGPKQVGADGVLRNSALRPAAGSAGMPTAEARPGSAGTGFPMTGGMGGGAREVERSRNTSMLEDDDLWRDETEVSPRVLGKFDQSMRNPEHGS